uniref:RNA pseudouridine synthase D3 n=1 Tax=Crocodylus porosus TaxID=8502 RepID=A0A7M4FGA2_CROPO
MLCLAWPRASRSSSPGGCSAQGPLRPTALGWGITAWATRPKLGTYRLAPAPAPELAVLVRDCQQQPAPLAGRGLEGWGCLCGCAGSGDQRGLTLKQSCGASQDAAALPGLPCPGGLRRGTSQQLPQAGAADAGGPAPAAEPAPGPASRAPRGQSSREVGVLPGWEPGVRGAGLGGWAQVQRDTALPRESSGLVLLSSCHATTQRLQGFFVQARRTGHPAATYCAVTVGVPADSKGEVCTGLKLEQVGDAQLVRVNSGSVARKEVKRTRTCYTVLGSAHGCTLLQLQPMTAFSGQLLVHLTLLLCPALGDHVYSARVGVVLGQPFLLPAESAPPCTQVLPQQLLHRLCLTQQQVHFLPLHLHLHQLRLPAVVLAAPPPPFFLRTLHRLGLPTHLEPQGGCRQ